MKKRRLTEEQIAFALRPAEAGMPIVEGLLFVPVDPGRTKNPATARGVWCGSFLPIG
jgi:hypothetical protein